MKRDSFVVFRAFRIQLLLCMHAIGDFTASILAKAMLQFGGLHIFLLCFLPKKDWIDIRYFPFVQGSGNRFQ